MGDLQEKAEYVERLLASTKIERFSYLVICVASAIFLLVCAVISVVRNHGDITVAISLFGSSGVITYTAGQIMRVWTDAMRLVMPPAPGGGDHGK
jgi:hypothetical protein